MIAFLTYSHFGRNILSSVGPLTFHTLLMSPESSDFRFLSSHLTTITSFTRIMHKIKGGLKGG